MDKKNFQTESYIKALKFFKYMYKLSIVSEHINLV